MDKRLRTKGKEVGSLEKGWVLGTIWCSVVKFLLLAFDFCGV